MIEYCADQREGIHVADRPRVEYAIVHDRSKAPVFLLSVEKR
jgi:hypothetical protein